MYILWHAYLFHHFLHLLSYLLKYFKISLNVLFFPNFNISNIFFINKSILNCVIESKITILLYTTTFSVFNNTNTDL